MIGAEWFTNKQIFIFLDNQFEPILTIHNPMYLYRSSITQ